MSLNSHQCSCTGGEDILQWLARGEGWNVHSQYVLLSKEFVLCFYLTLGFQKLTNKAQHIRSFCHRISIQSLHRNTTLCCGRWIEWKSSGGMMICVEFCWSAFETPMSTSRSRIKPPVTCRVIYILVIWSP